MLKTKQGSITNKFSSAMSTENALAQMKASHNHRYYHQTSANNSNQPNQPPRHRHHHSSHPHTHSHSHAHRSSSGQSRRQQRSHRSSKSGRRHRYRFSSNVSVSSQSSASSTVSSQRSAISNASKSKKIKINSGVPLIDKSMPNCEIGSDIATGVAPIYKSPQMRSSAAVPSSIAAISASIAYSIVPSSMGGGDTHTTKAKAAIGNASINHNHSDSKATIVITKQIISDINNSIDNSGTDSDLSSIASLSKRKKGRRHKTKRCKSGLFCRSIQLLINLLINLWKATISLLTLIYVTIRAFRKEMYEADAETRQRYYFILSTIFGSVFFYVLFEMISIILTHPTMIDLPDFLLHYTFSIAWCSAYLISVVWQHFFNHFLVFELNASPTLDTECKHKLESGDTDDNGGSNGVTFCQSLCRAYLVYGFSLVFSTVLGTLLQQWSGLPQRLILLITLPVSGVTNYYLLRRCSGGGGAAKPKMVKFTTVAGGATKNKTINNSNANGTNMGSNNNSDSNSYSNLLYKSLNWSKRALFNKKYKAMTMVDDIIIL